MIGKRIFSFEVRGPGKTIFATHYNLDEAIDHAIAINLRTRLHVIVVRVDYEVIADLKSFTNKTYVQHLKDIENATKRL